MVEWLKVKAPSSSPSAAKKKKKKERVWEMNERRGSSSKVLDLPAP
jgi:hypothetical protein